MSFYFEEYTRSGWRGWMQLLSARERSHLELKGEWKCVDSPTWFVVFLWKLLAMCFHFELMPMQAKCWQHENHMYKLLQSIYYTQTHTYIYTCPNQNHLYYKIFTFQDICLILWYRKEDRVFGVANWITSSKSCKVDISIMSTRVAMFWTYPIAPPK